MVDQAITSTAQIFLDIFDITNDILIMKDGSTAIILTVDALNFGLLAEEEQDGIIYAYAGLLNSLNYPIQIVIHSQTKDVTSYLNLLKVQEDQTVSQTKQGQIKRYREFVTNLIKERNVLDKKFYVAIPASPIEMGVVSAQSVIPGVKNPDVSTFDRSMILEKAHNTLEPKRDHLISQFGRIGLYARQLNTQEIIQLFYVSYNPEAAEGQKLTDSNNYTTPLVRASVQGDLMTDQNTITTTPTPDQIVAANDQDSPQAMGNTQTQASSQPVATTVTPIAPQPTPMPQPQVVADQVMPATPTNPVMTDQNQTPMPAQSAQPTVDPAQQAINSTLAQMSVGMPQSAPAASQPTPMPQPQVVADQVASPNPVMTDQNQTPMPAESTQLPTPTPVQAMDPTPMAAPTTATAPAATPPSPTAPSPAAIPEI